MTTGIGGAVFPQMPCVSFGGCFYNKLSWWVWGIQLFSTVDSVNTCL